VTPAPTPSPSPSPTPVDRAAAAQAYLAAAGSYNKANDALAKKYPTFKTVAQGRAFFAARAKLGRIFADAVRRIVFPPDMAADVRSLLAKDAALEAAEIEASSARTGSELLSAAKAVQSTGRAAAAAANLVRQDLGLPSVPKP
jgi:hypothetical protein